MIHAYKLVVLDAGAGSKGSAAAGNKKKQAPAPLSNVVLEAVPLFSIAHTAKLNALACVFGPVLAVVGGAAAGVEMGTAGAEEVIDGVNAKAMIADADAGGAASTGAQAGETVFRTTEATAASADTTPSVAGVCRCCVADTTGEISVYTRSYT
jgi:hypothetical protein